MDEKSEPAAASEPDRRVHQRSCVLCEASLRRDGSNNYRVQVYDLSEGGCKVEIVERPSVGEGVWIKFERLEALHATVSWIDPPVAGLQFEKPIHPAVFDGLLRRLSQPG